MPVKTDTEDREDLVAMPEITKLDFNQDISCTSSTVYTYLSVCRFIVGHFFIMLGGGHFVVNFEQIAKIYGCEEDGGRTGLIRFCGSHAEDLLGLLLL